MTTATATAATRVLYRRPDSPTAHATTHPAPRPARTPAAPPALRRHISQVHPHPPPPGQGPARAPAEGVAVARRLPGGCRALAREAAVPSRRGPSPARGVGTGAAGLSSRGGWWLPGLAGPAARGLHYKLSGRKGCAGAACWGWRGDARVTRALISRRRRCWKAAGRAKPRPKRGEGGRAAAPAAPRQPAKAAAWERKGRRSPPRRAPPAGRERQTGK